MDDEKPNREQHVDMKINIDGLSETDIYRNIFETVFDFTFIKDLQGRYMMVNRALAEHVGRPREEIIGLCDAELFVDDDENPMRIENEDARVLAGERFEDRRIRHIGGNLHCYHIIKVPLFDDENRIRGLCGVVRDITGQEMLADELNTLTAHLKGVTDNLPGLAFSYLYHPDNTRTALYLSPGLENLVGDTAGAALRKDPAVWDSMVHPDDLAGLASSVRDKGDNHRSIDAEFRLRDTQGDYRWVHSLSRGVEQGNGDLLWHGILLDVDDRKRMQTEFEETSERQRSLAEGLPGAIYSYVSDSQDRCTVLFYSPGLAELVGPENMTRVLQQDEFLDLLLHPDDLGRQTEMKITGEPGRLIHDHEYRLHTDAGTYRWVHSRASGQAIGNGSTMWHGFLLDIDDRKRTEEQLRLASDRLRIYSSSLEETNRTLNEVKAQAEAASLAKSQFLANMSHEIRTPLTGVIGLAEILAERIQDSENADILKVIQKNSDFLLQIINDILDVSKIEAGRLPVHTGSFNPEQELREVAELMSVPAEQKGLELLLTIKPGLPESFSGDSTRLRQILINLLGNAIKFTDRGQVTLGAEYNGGDEPELCVEVLDTGIGVDTNRIEDLFEAFKQGDGSSSRSFEGTGLGLTISKSLAELMGGRIEVAGRPEGGSRFRLCLPGAPPEEAPEDRTESLPAPGTLNAHVLLAEDNVTNQIIVQSILEARGCTLAIAANGAEAIELEAAARSTGQPFDAILMDIQMPVMDGLSATRALREAGCDLPIIALTAHAFDSDRRRSLDAGCNDHCNKPINTDLLIGMLARHIKE